ncbi:PSD1 and planctomycete cytochrome C domain-containing protein [Tautonia marina]|uniref:PSD1 and planctomycete cytochrome C domain-containing protein n=1 Tax=Tautonia marina TaxID=2653855 RepID=UPI0012606AF1|nr:PSD1 and planctomycete cytochrome C domain-containing protein [Tautonia marina]
MLPAGPDRVSARIRRGRRWARLLALVSLVSLALGTHVDARDDVTRNAFFEERIRPALILHCAECHGAAKQAGGLRVDWREGLLEGGHSGPAIEPGNPDESLLVLVMEHAEPGLEMPRKAPKLSDEILRDFRSWILDGAYDPRVSLPSPEESAQDEWSIKLAERRTWWSLQPVVSPSVPEPDGATWAQGPVDRFILDRLLREGLRPAEPAEPAVLARRLAFVLTGLPLDETSLDEFLDDPSPSSYERLVDRLLNSPHFGERWARHWMDVVRYGDTYGYEWDIPAKGAWRYRDYLVRAFNADVPFDQLVREQIAGDLLEHPRIDPVEGIVESLAGPMFFQLGEKRHGDSAEFDGIHQEMLNNKIDAFSKAFLGLTVGCARCHDHKLDAISQRDYHALAGVFMSPRWVSRTLDTRDRNAEVLTELRELKPSLRDALADWWRPESARWGDALIASADSSDPSNLWAAAVQSAGEEPTREHPLFAWVTMLKAEREGSDLASTWDELASGYTQEREQRLQQNAASFTVVADFSNGVPPGWSAEGEGLRDGPVRSGDFAVAIEGDAILDAILPAGLFTHALSPRLNGALRSPMLNALPSPWLNWEVCGGEFSAERTVVDNAFLTERQTYLARKAPAWSGYPALPEFTGRRVYRELATKTSNPNFPPRVGLGGACSEEQAADPRSWFGVTRAVVSEQAGIPQDELGRFVSLFDGPSPDSLAAVAEAYQQWFRAALDRWAADEANDDDTILLNWLLDHELLPNHLYDTSPPALQALVDAYRTTERKIREPQTINGMVDLDEGIDDRINIRGNYADLGPPVPRGFLEVLSADAEDAAFRSVASGRRELAERVASPDNPLTARVYVNRLWQWAFGAGLVGSPDDFGKLGAPPSHPELLDWLAVRLVDEGWSTKRMVRELVLSATFRQGSMAIPEAAEIDPDNRLLAHYPLRRLDAESIRDAILAASGRLDPRLYGPPINPHRSSEDPSKRLFSGPVDGDNRRSFYTKLTVMEPPRFLALFNQPPPKIPTGRRDVTNIPTQALALLNDPFVTDQASSWGARVAASPADSVADQLTTMFQGALGRGPNPAEQDRWSSLVNDLAAERSIAPEDVLTAPEIWADVAHTLFNTKEFLYLR